MSLLEAGLCVLLLGAAKSMKGMSQLTRAMSTFTASEGGLGTDVASSCNHITDQFHWRITSGILHFCMEHRPVRLKTDSRLLGQIHGLANLFGDFA